MSRNLGSQCRTIRSPWPDYAVYSFPDASVVGESDRPSLMDAMNGIIAVNWKATEPHWTAASSPFDGKYGLILVFDMSGLIAFSAYRVLNVAGTPRHLPQRHRGAAGASGPRPVRLLHLRGPENVRALQIKATVACSTDGERATRSCGRRTPGFAKR